MIKDLLTKCQWTSLLENNKLKICILDCPEPFKKKLLDKVIYGSSFADCCNQLSIILDEKPQ